MTQIEKLIENLEEQYNLSIDSFITYYVEGYTRSEIAEAMKTTEWSIRLIASALNLRFQKEHRANDYSLYVTRFSESAESMLQEKLAGKSEECDYLSRQLFNKEKALVEARYMLNSYRKEVRKQGASDSITGAIIEALGDSLEKPRVLMPAIPPLNRQNTCGIQFALFSDVHAESSISNDDTGLGDYSWEDTEIRIAEVFSEVSNLNCGEDRLLVVLAGDLIDGIIHDTLEATTKPTMKAVVDLVDIFAGHINGLVDRYDEVSVVVVNGNHSRLSEKIKSNAKGYDIEYILGHLLEAKLHDKVNVTISTTGLAAFYLEDNTYIGIHHGDLFRGATSNDLNVLQRFKQVYGQSPTHLMQGHLHKFSVSELPTGGIKIINGALVNPNAYAATSGFTLGAPSQTVGAFTHTGNIFNILPVFFR